MLLVRAAVSAPAVEQAEQQLSAARANVVQAEASAIKAQADLQRYKPLVDKDVISKQQWDAAVAAADATKAQVASAQHTEQAAQDAGDWRIAHYQVSRLD